MVCPVQTSTPNKREVFDVLFGYVFVELKIEEEEEDMFG